MGFSEVLDGLMSQVRGVVAAGVMASDGLPLEMRTVDGGPDIEVIGAELCVVFRTLYKGIEDVDAGGFIDFVGRYERYTYVIRTLTHEYFALIVIGPDGIAGQARFHLAKAAGRLAGEF